MMMVRSLASCVLTAFAVAAVGLPGKAFAQDPVASLVGEVDLTVDSVEIVEGQVVANAVLSVEIADRTLTQEIPIPLEVGALPGEEGECDVLTLALEPVDQELAGLVVELDDCDGGPVLIMIQPVEDEAVEGELGELVCDVATAVLEGADLETILAALPEEDAALLNATLVEVLNETFAALVAEGEDDGEVAAAASSGKGKGGGKGKSKGKSPGKGDDDEDDDDDDSDDDSGKGSKRVELVDLEIDGLVGLDVSGLLVDTSDVCLEIYAEGGQGNLLGNMLRQLDHLMSRPGKTGKAQQAILKNLRRALARLEALSL